MTKMISFSHKGDFRKSYRFFDKAKTVVSSINFETYGQMGVAALEEATPKNTGLTSKSWSYEIVRKNDSVAVYFSNSNTAENGYVSIALILQYGHAARNGIWIEGRDYINPAVAPVFDNIVTQITERIRDL